MVILAKARLNKKIFVSLIILFSSVLFCSARVFEIKAISITDGPSVINIQATSASIDWDTDISGDSQVYYTVSNGPKWNLLNKNTVNQIDDVDFINQEEGWGVGRFGTIIHTTDGGVNWSIQNSGTVQNFREIIALDTNNLWAVTGGNQVLKSTDGGDNWSLVYTGSKILLGIYTSNNINVSVCGSDGFVAMSNNGGSNWSTLSIPTTETLIDIDGYGNKLWAVGENGAIIYSANGGSSWMDQSYNTTRNLYAIDVFDGNNATIVGQYGMVLHTNNAGSNWTSQSSDTSNNLYNVEHINAATIVATGVSGTTIRTTDSGNIWSSITPPSVMTFNGLSVLRYDSFYGSGDQLYKYGVFYDSMAWDATQTTNHTVFLGGLSPATTYYYYVCSRNASTGQEVCSNDKSFETLGFCSDGTPEGQCNPVTLQYCEGTTLMPLDGTQNCVHCGFDCSTTPNKPYCNNSTQTCETKCSDGTLPGKCNLARQYCDSSLVLHTDCSTNIEECNYTCPASTPYCNPGTGQCQPGCDVNTPLGGCSGTQYCDPATGNFVNDCRQCGYTCPSANPYCDNNTGLCGAGCDVNTPLGACLGTQYCDPNTSSFINDCRQCGYTCPITNIYCNDTTGQCQPGCDVNTPSGGCSGTQYCDPDSLTLVNNCNYCGYTCPSATPYCRSDGQCDQGCDVNTPLGSCSGTQYCDPATGNFVNDCRQCGYTCPSVNPYCNSDTGQCEAFERCTDGTPSGECNAAGQYCTADLELSNNCQINEANCPNFDCPANTPYCNTDTGQCVQGCDSNTPSGGCSGTLYCNPTDLAFTYDCRQCGYTCSAPTPQCNTDTGLCEADITPPEICNIEVIPDVYSAVLTFDTTTKADCATPEETWAEISLNITENCLGSVATIGIFEYTSNFTVNLSDLLPLTTYYYCLTVYDAAGNSTSTGDPTRLQFTTLAEPDLTPPAVTINTPTEGETIYGTYTITLTASDNVALDYINLHLDGNTTPLASLAGSTATSYQYDLDTRAYENGAHTLQARAFDTSDNMGESGVRNFLINNDLGPPILENVKADVSKQDDYYYQAVISWTTNEEATSRVDFTLENEDGSYDEYYGNRDGSNDDCSDVTHCRETSGYTTEHSVTLTNLLPNRVYHYRITTCDAQNNCSH